ncbi:MAG: hypothetical protein MHM6MM_002191 [Cercozoa sp. M6MM]
MAEIAPIWPCEEIRNSSDEVLFGSLLTVEKFSDSHKRCLLGVVCSLLDASRLLVDEEDSEDPYPALFARKFSEFLHAKEKKEKHEENANFCECVALPLISSETTPVMPWFAALCDEFPCGREGKYRLESHFLLLLMHFTITQMPVSDFSATRYDARIRAALSKFCAIRELPLKFLRQHERFYAVRLKHAALKDERRTNATDDEERERRLKEQQKRKYLKWLKIGGAAAVGGTLMAVTGGLAIPALLAGLGALGVGTTFLAGTVGVALLHSLFATAGIGLAGWRMKRRVGDLEEFRFEPIESDEDECKVAVTITVSGFCDAESVDFDVLVDNEVRRLNGENNADDTEIARTVDGDQEAAKLRRRAVASQWRFLLAHIPEPEEESDDEEENNDESSDEKAKAAAISTEVRKIFMPAAESSETHFALCFDTHHLSSMGAVIQSFAAQQAKNFVVTETLKQTALKGVLAALAWPSMLVSASGMIDNSWSVVCNRADLAAFALADVLEDMCTLKVTDSNNNDKSNSSDKSRSKSENESEKNKDFGEHRAVTLFAFSVGARVVVRALLELVRRCEALPRARALRRLACIRGIVQNVVLVGAAVHLSPEEWRQCRSLVSGAFINAHSNVKTDWLLAFLYRVTAAALTEPVAGLAPVGEEAGILNVFIGDIAKGHHRLPQALPAISLRCLQAQRANLQRLEG